MQKDVIVFLVLIVLEIVGLAVMWYKGKKELVKELILRAMTIAEVALGSKKGQEKLAIALEQVIFKISTWGKFSGWLASLIFTREHIMSLIELFVPKINKDFKGIIETQNGVSKEKIYDALEKGIVKGIEIGTDKLVQKAIPLDVDGNQNLVSNSQLIGLANNIKLEAKDNGFATAYAEFKTDFEKEQELRAGVSVVTKF